MKLPARAHHRERNGSVSKKDQMNISGWPEMTKGGGKEPAWTGWWQRESLPQGNGLTVQLGAFIPWVVLGHWGCSPRGQLASEVPGVGARGSGVSPLPLLPSESDVTGRERWLSRDQLKKPSPHNTVFAKPDTRLFFCFWLLLLIFWSSVAKKGGTFASSGVIPFHYFYLLRIKHDLLKATRFNTKRRKTN